MTKEDYHKYWDELYQVLEKHNTEFGIQHQDNAKLAIIFLYKEMQDLKKEIAELKTPATITGTLTVENGGYGK